MKTIGAVGAVAVTPDGGRAVSGSLDRTLRLWDLGTGQRVRTLEGHTSSVRAVALTPDGRRAVSGSGDHTLRLWDLESGQCLGTLEGHTSSVRAVALTPDGRRALSASDDRTLRLWDLESGQCLRTLEGHRGAVDAVAVLPDGRRAVSGSVDYTLRLWDLESGKKIATFTGEDDMDACAVALDGQTIIAGDASGRVHILRLVEADPTKHPPGESKIQLLHREERQPVNETEESKPMLPPNTHAVFISYAHADNESRNTKERWLDRFVEFLKPLVRQEDFTLCSDQDIKIGENWHQHIQAHLNGAKAVVLLISPAFLASDYIANSELPVILKNAADKEGVKILPIIISPCLYEETRFKYPDTKKGPEEFTLASIQAANPPSETLVEMDEGERNRVLLKVARRLSELLRENPQ